MKSWFDGIQLLGVFGPRSTGCWLLSQRHEAAILEMPPHDHVSIGWSPATAADAAVRELGLDVKYVLCTHAHLGHFSNSTLSALRDRFPEAEVHLQRGFARFVDDRAGRIRWIGKTQELVLGGEPLYLVHAPKHSQTDTLVIFRGTICTGDWELGTLRSPQDWRSGITTGQKMESMARLRDFLASRNYGVHQLYSSHADHRRTHVDLELLLDDPSTTGRFASYGSW